MRLNISEWQPRSRKITGLKPIDHGPGVHQRTAGFRSEVPLRKIHQILPHDFAVEFADVVPIRDSGKDSIDAGITGRDLVRRIIGDHGSRIKSVKVLLIVDDDIRLGTVDRGVVDNEMRIAFDGDFPGVPDHVVMHRPIDALGDRPAAAAIKSQPVLVRIVRPVVADNRAGHARRIKLNVRPIALNRPHVIEIVQLKNIGINLVVGNRRRFQPAVAVCGEVANVREIIRRESAADSLRPSRRVHRVSAKQKLRALVRADRLAVAMRGRPVDMMEQAILDCIANA